MPKIAIRFLLSAFQQEPLPFIQYKFVASLLKQVAEHTRTDMLADQYRDELYLPVLMCLTERFDIPESQRLLDATMESFAGIKQSSAAASRCAQMWFTASLYLKQADPTGVNLNSLHESFKKNVLQDDQSMIAEFFIQTAMEGKELIKRIFAVLSLVKLL